MTTTHSEHTPNPGGMPDWLVGAAIAEAVALVIALIMPFTPSKTGSTWSPAELFTPDPSYLAQVVAGFVLIHAIYLLFGIPIWLSGRRRRGD